jgi:hypothetical protein
MSGEINDQNGSGEQGGTRTSQTLESCSRPSLPHMKRLAAALKSKLLLLSRRYTHLPSPSLSRCP